MKKLFLVLFVAMAVGSASLQAQVRAENTNSVNFSLKGLNYNMERAYGESFTMTYGFSLGGIYNPDDILVVAPGIRLEPRIYYNLSRRSQNNRNVKYNSGEFFSFDLQVIAPMLPDDVSLAILFTPKWGMRRMLTDNLYLELTLGIGISIISLYPVVYTAPGLRLGYIF